MPIKVKDSAKCKEWEQRRRDRLNDAFNNLAQLLPHYDPAKIPAKLEILEKSTEFVKELRLSNSRLLSSQAENDEKCRLIKELQDEVNKLILRVKQLTHLLKTASITIPVGPEIKSLGSKRLKWSGKLKPGHLESTTVIPVSAASNASPVLESTTPSENKSPPTDGGTAAVSNKDESKVKPPSESAVPGSSPEKCEMPPITSTASIIIPLKEVNISKPNSTNISAPPYTVTSGAPPKCANNESPPTSSASKVTPVSSSPSPLKLVSSTDPIFTTTSTTPIQLPLQTFIITPCPITGSALPSQTSQLFTTRIALPTPLLPKTLDGLSLQKIAIKPVLKPIPRVIRRRKRRSKKTLEGQEEEKQTDSKKTDINVDALKSTDKITVSIGPNENPVPNKTIPTKPDEDLEKLTSQKNDPTLPEKSDDSRVGEKIPNVREENEAVAVVELSNVQTSKSPGSVPLSSQECDKDKESLHDSGEKCKEKDVSSSDNIPVLRIIESHAENGKRDDSDVLSKVIITDNCANVAEDRRKETQEIMCITIEDDDAETGVVNKETVSPTQSLSGNTEVIKNVSDVSSETGVEIMVVTSETEEIFPVDNTQAQQTKINETNSEESTPLLETEKESESQKKVLETVSHENMDVRDAEGEEEILVQSKEGHLADTISLKEVPKDMHEQETVKLTQTTCKPREDETVETSLEETPMEVDSDNCHVVTEIDSIPAKTPGSTPTAVPIVPSYLTEPSIDSPKTRISLSVAGTEIQQSQAIELSEEARAGTSLDKQTEKIFKEPSSKTSSTIATSLHTPQKQVINSDTSESVTTTEKISECIARSIDLIDANDSELMELGEHWEGTAGSPRSPISPTQMFLNIFPLLPRENSATEPQHNQHHQAQLSQSQTIPTQTVLVGSNHTSQKGLSSSRSSFFIDAMLPEDHSTQSHAAIHESLELLPASSETSCLALTPPQYSIPASNHNQQPSSPFSFSNNYYWTPSSTCSYESSLDFRSSSQIVGGTTTSIFSNLPVPVPATAPSTSTKTATTSKAVPVTATTLTPSLAPSHTNSTASLRKLSKSISNNIVTPTTSISQTKSTHIDVSSNLPSLSRSSSNKSATSSAAAISTITATSTNVTWTLTTPSQSSSSSTPHSHHHHYHPQSSSQITQFPSTSSCSLFDALTPMDASFFRPLMNALETNDFRALEFPNSSVLPPPPPPLPALIPPPAKSLYVHPPKNVSMNLNSSTGSQNEHPQQQQHHPTALFDNVAQQPFHSAVPSETTKKQREKEQPSATARSIKQSQMASNDSSSQNLNCVSPTKTSDMKGRQSRNAAKQKAETSKQSRSGKSSRTQPYVMPSNTNSSTSSKTSSHSQERNSQLSNFQHATASQSESHPSQLFHSDYSYSYGHCSKKSSSSNNTDFQGQNLFASNAGSNLVVHPSSEHNKVPPTAQNSTHPVESQKQHISKSSTQSKLESKCSRIKEDKSPSRLKGRSLQQPATATVAAPQSQNPPSQPQSSSRINETQSISQQLSLHIQSKVPHKSTVHGSSNNSLPHSIPQDLQFHHPESFQLFPDFHHSHHQQQPNVHSHQHPSEQSSADFPAQISHHHHHPYYLSDITPPFESFTSHNPVHSNPPPFQSSPQQTQHTQHNNFLPAPTNTNASTGNTNQTQTLSLRKNILNSSNSDMNQANAAQFNANQKTQNQPNPCYPQQPLTSHRHPFPHSHQSNSSNLTENFPYNQQTTQHTALNQAHSDHQNRTSHSQEQLPSQHHRQQNQSVQHQQQRQIQRSSTTSTATPTKTKPPQSEPGRTHHPQVPPPIPFQANASQQQTQPSHQMSVPLHHHVPSHVPQQNTQKPQQSQQPHQQINRPSSSRTVNWMTDTAYRTSTPRSSTSSSVHSTTNKQQQPQRPQNNPFSVSKLVGNTSAKSHTAATNAVGHALSGGNPTDVQVKSKNKSGTSTNSGSISQPTQNQSNYCAEALIRKDPTAPEWTDFNFPGYSSHHNLQPPNNNHDITSSEFSNYHAHYHYHHGSTGGSTHSSSSFSQSENVQVQHFHHPPPQHLNPSSYPSGQQHPNQQNHPQAGQTHYPNTPNPMHFQAPQQPQQFSYNQNQHSHHSSSTSSVSNFNLSSIFPEINDKRNGGNVNSSTSQTTGQSNNNQVAGENIGSGGRTVTGTSASSGRATAAGGSGSGNMCTFQHHPPFSNPNGNSGNNNSMHH